MVTKRHDYAKKDLMGIRAFYNEIDPFCCAWLSNLMDAGLITPGTIDDRSILALRPEDLRGYDRAHLFAGIGVWDYALTRAGWPDDGRVTWTGSCPCQPLSGAGQRKGHADEPNSAVGCFWETADGHA